MLSFLKKNAVLVILSALFVFSMNFDAVSQNKSFPQVKKFPKNIILFIGDGMAKSQVVVANYYTHGQDKVQVYQNFPYIYHMSTFPGKDNSGVKYTQSYISEKNWADFNYVKNGYTDSAPAGTAMSTGEKTFDGAIGVDLDKNPLVHITAHAKALGKAAGVVSTVQLSHATPAAFVAHNNSRNNYSAIAQEMFNSDLDLIMGAGNPWFDDNGTAKATPNYNYVGGQQMWDNMKNGLTEWKLIQTKAEFEALQTGNTPARVAGVPQVATTTQQARSGNNQAAPFVVPFNSNIPSLEVMTKGAINVLDNNENGFFLMVEGGAIDWACHSNQLGRTIEEQIDFNKAVQAGIDWVEQNSNWDETLIIVTGDHETGYLTGPNDNDANPNTNPIVNNGIGSLPGVKWNSGNHTNMVIPAYIKGAGAEIFDRFADEVDKINGRYFDNTELGIAMKLLFPMPQTTFKSPKNIIFLISDGMGLSHIQATNYYQHGADNTSIYQNFPVKLYQSTYAGKNDNIKTWTLGYDSESNWNDFNYVKSGYTDSAPAATSMASGFKAYDGAIGFDLLKVPVKSIAEKFKEMGRAAGAISSVEFAHATPAGFVAHNVSRNNYSTIAQEMIDSDMDVIMGPGHPWYDDNNVMKANPNYTYVGGEQYWNNLKNGYKNWTLIETKQQFIDLANGSTPSRLFGVPQVASTLQQGRSGSGSAAPYVVALNQNVPTLLDMTKASINVLDNNEKGFFLMVEGGAIDWAAHSNQTGRMIEEQIDFNNTVDFVVNWVNTHSNWDETLVIVTGDHETGYLTGPNSNNSNPLTNPIINNGQGNVPSVKWNSGSHTNTLIPVYFKGAGSEFFNLVADQRDKVYGKYINNTEIAQGMYHLLEIMHPLEINLNDKTTCKGEQTEISNTYKHLGKDYNVSVVGGTNNYTVKWTPVSQIYVNPNNPLEAWKLNPTDNQTYTLLATDNTTKESVMANVKLLMYPTVTINVPILFRHPKNTDLNLNSLISNYDSKNIYSWRDDSGVLANTTVKPNVGMTRYYVSAVDENNCSVVEKRTTVYVSPFKEGMDNFSVSESGSFALVSYPNPVVDKLILNAELSAEQSIITISIMDMAGSTISSYEKVSGKYLFDEINVENLSNGVYFLKVVSNEETLIHKFVK